MPLLSDRVALVTGASRGIGRAIAESFAREGARVVCASRSADLLEETVRLVRASGGNAVGVGADVSREADVRRVVEQAIDAYGRVDALVNNAGDGGPTKPVQEYTAEEWEYTIGSCLTSAYLCTRFAVPAMIQAGGGAIVNISSMAGRRGLPFRVGYCAAKAGMIGMTVGLALELGKHGITVNAIAPGAVAGDRIERVIEGQARARSQPIEKVRASVIGRSPLGRMTTAGDIASLAAFLCSDLARNISGQCIPVTAGEPA